MKETFRIHFPLAILAGLCISIGCTVNMKVGGVAGAVLFAFGLTTVVYYGLKLYTGTAGFIRRQGDWGMLLIVLVGNIVGCLLTSLALRYAHPDLVDSASAILSARSRRSTFTMASLITSAAVPWIGMFSATRSPKERMVKFPFSSGRYRRRWNSVET